MEPLAQVSFRIRDMFNATLEKNSTTIARHTVWMFCRGLEIKCSWKVDKEVKSRLDCSVTKQEPSPGKVERSDNASGSVADAGGRDQAEDKDRSTYKYV